MTTRTTSHLKLPSARAWYDLSTPVCAALVIFLLLLIALIVGRVRSAQQATAVPTALPAITIIQTAQPARPAPPAVAQLAAVLPSARYVVAFASPSGDVLGAIPEPVASAITGRYGDSWISTSWQGSTVWLRAADIGLNLANVAPAPAAQVIYVAQEAAPTPAQVVLSTGSVDGVSERQTNIQNHYVNPPALQQSAILDRQQWAIQAAAARAQPTAAPAPSQPGAVERALNVAAWRESHCYIDQCW